MRISDWSSDVCSSDLFDFRNFAVTGLFDGRLPLLFNADGGRIVGGRLIARSPGGTLAYVGEVSEADIGGAGKLAFDALKSLKYNAQIGRAHVCTPVPNAHLVCGFQLEKKYTHVSEVHMKTQKRKS